MKKKTEEESPSCVEYIYHHTRTMNDQICWKKSDYACKNKTNIAIYQKKSIYMGVSSTKGTYVYIFFFSYFLMCGSHLCVDLIVFQS